MSRLAKQFGVAVAQEAVVDATGEGNYSIPCKYSRRYLTATMDKEYAGEKILQAKAWQEWRDAFGEGVTRWSILVNTTGTGLFTRAGG